MLGYLLSCCQVNLFLCLRQLLPTGKPRERQAHSIAFNLKDTSKHLFCAIGVPVGEVQLAPLSLPRGARGQLATPPSWYRADPASNRGPAFIRYAALINPPAFIRGRRLFEEIRYFNRLVPIFNGCLFLRGCLYTRSPCVQLKWVLILIGCLFCMGAYYPESTVLLLTI